MDNKTEQEIYLESDGIQNVDEPEGGDLGSNTVSTAIELQPSVWTDGRIIYPEGEVWYKFTPSVSGYYTIYTIGDSDTVGFLYDAEQNLLMDADDNGVATNFKLVYNLEEGNTYYIKVMICGNEIGDFSIAAVNTVWVESVTVSDEALTLNKGETLAMTATVLPSYATNKAVRWGSSNADIVEVNTFTGEITAKGRGTARICALSQDGSAKMSCCEVTVNVLVDSVTVEPATRVMHVGAQEQFTATVLPLDANNPLLRWHSSDTTVAAVNEASGCVTARAVGTVNIYATAQDGSGKQGVCAVTVLPAVPVQGICLCPNTHTMNVGETVYLSYDIYPSDATNKTLTWYSSDPNVAEVDLSTGEITAKRAGITTVTATTNDGSFSASCELWIKGKTPVILIHGRTDNSKGVWGVNNNIPSGQNNHFDPNMHAESLNGKKYIEIASQHINGFDPDNGETDSDNPCHLGNALLSAGYKANINLFAFNYPNQDAVKYSAQKLRAYVLNLIFFVRESGADEMKTSFYESRSDYNSNNYKINIVGHSMGGLVARYYIENLYQDNHVDKLITICTPHWGSGYANLSNLTGDLWGMELHALCDHDLDFDSAMYGGSNSTTINCDKGGCPGSNYTVTPELQYQRQRSTKYYAIAGIDYPAGPVFQNNYAFEMSTHYTTYEQIDDFMVGKKVYRYQPSDFNPQNAGDNMVGFMSQIGWTENSGNTPNKKIQMKKIFIDVDTDGGNGGGVFLWEIINGLGSEIFHNKAPHRAPVCNKVIEYLGD